MRNRSKHITLAGLACAALNTAALAQATETAPLNVIDWLDQQPATIALPAQPTEPDVTASGAVPQVSVAPLNTTAAQRVGLAPASVTGLPDTLWSGRNGAVLARAVRDMPVLQKK
mmetsp:Transcript_18235/g.28733  ORF Transcript_18235/g.28733 Transcript_18235/m.28733 type:complete len:115 (+) Transcript_18235:247-591(+)